MAKGTRTTAAVLAGALLWAYTAWHYWHASFGYRGTADFELLLRAIRAWQDTGEFSIGYWYPPLFYAVNLPFTLLPDAAAVNVMLAVNHALLAACLALVAAAVPERTGARLWVWVLLPVALNFRPLLLLLSMAKVEMLQLTLLTGALVALQRGREGLAGSLTALAGMLKPLPLMAVLYFLATRRWRAARAWTVTIAALLAVSVALVGAGAVWSYFSTLAMPRGDSAIYWYEDQSLMGVAVRWYHQVRANQFYVSPEAVRPVELLTGWVLRGAVACWLAGIVFRRAEPSQSRLAGEWAIASAGMLLLSPLSRDYYAVFLLPAYVWLAAAVWERRGGWAAGWLAAASYGLVGQGFPLGVIRRLPPLLPGVDNFHTYLHYGVPTLGYLLLIMAWARVLKTDARVGDRTPIPPESRVEAVAHA